MLSPSMFGTSTALPWIVRGSASIWYVVMPVGSTPDSTPANSSILRGVSCWSVTMYSDSVWMSPPATSGS